MGNTYSVYFACMYYLLPMYQIQEVNALLARGSNFAVFQIENAKIYLCGKTTVLRILRLENSAFHIYNIWLLNGILQ